MERRHYQGETRSGRVGRRYREDLVEAGNKRAKEQGLTNCKFQEGDASNLHELKDHTFDLVVSHVRAKAV